jgi:hypothetical protein
MNPSAGTSARKVSGGKERSAHASGETAPALAEAEAEACGDALAEGLAAALAEGLGDAPELSAPGGSPAPSAVGACPGVRVAAAKPTPTPTAADDNTASTLTIALPRRGGLCPSTGSVLGARFDTATPSLHHPAPADQRHFASARG